MMYPTFFPQLSHDRIDPRISRLALAQKDEFITQNQAKISFRLDGRAKAHLRSPTWRAPPRFCPMVSARKSDCPASDRNSDSLSRRSRRIRATEAVRVMTAVAWLFLSVWERNY